MSTISKAKALDTARRALLSLDDAQNRKFGKAARSDPDNPPITASEFRRARGRPKLSEAERKQRITIMLDREVLDHYRADGPGWQTRINDTLMRAVGRKR